MSDMVPTQLLDTWRKDNLESKRRQMLAQESFSRLVGKTNALESEVNSLRMKVACLTLDLDSERARQVRWRQIRYAPKGRQVVLSKWTDGVCKWILDGGDWSPFFKQATHYCELETPQGAKKGE